MAKIAAMESRGAKHDDWIIELKAEGLWQNKHSAKAEFLPDVLWKALETRDWVDGPGWRRYANMGQLSLDICKMIDQCTVWNIDEERGCVFQYMPVALSYDDVLLIPDALPRLDEVGRGRQVYRGVAFEARGLLADQGLARDVLGIVHGYLQIAAPPPKTHSLVHIGDSYFEYWPHQLPKAIHTILKLNALAHSTKGLDRRATGV